jgi:hypothetical protein
MDTTFSTHAGWDEAHKRPFLLPPMEAAEIFLDPMWAVRIDEVLIAGAPAEPAPFTGQLDDLNFARMEMRGMPMIQHIAMNEMIVAGLFDSPEAFDLVLYTVPAMAEVVEITYRACYAPGVFSMPMKLLSVRV